jgi:hypothetical protein
MGLVNAGCPICAHRCRCSPAAGRATSRCRPRLPRATGAPVNAVDQVVEDSYLALTTGQGKHGHLPAIVMRPRQPVQGGNRRRASRRAPPRQPPTGALSASPIRRRQAGRPAGASTIRDVATTKADRCLGRGAPPVDPIRRSVGLALSWHLLRRSLALQEAQGNAALATVISTRPTVRGAGPLRVCQQVLNSHASRRAERDAARIHPSFRE